MANTILTLLSYERLKQFYEAGYWRDDTVFSLAADHARRAPERIAIRDKAGALTYGELIARAESLAGQIARAGVRKGQRVAAWLPSRIETAIILLACSRNGYVCCPSLHRDHTAEEILDLLRRMNAAVFIGERGYGADADQRDIFTALDTVESLKLTMRLDPVTGADGETRDFPAADATGPAGPPNTDPNVVVYLAFTSGTTGRPKGVMHSDNTLLANARAMIDDWGFDADSIFYAMSPFSHNLGLGTLITALATGGEVVAHDLPRGHSVLDRIIEVGATFIVGVPTHAIDLLEEIKKRDRADVERIRGFRISGASAPRDVVAELMRYGIRPQSGYGMTEAGSHHYTRPDDSIERIVGSSGRACASYEVSIRSMEDPEATLPPGQEGQIAGRGASLMLGYFDDQKANEEAFDRNGWFLTGDIGRLDEDGYLEITGRKKELIIRGGHNIYPAKIEALARQHPAVQNAVAIPLPDKRLGEKVCIVVRPEPGASLDPQDLLAHLHQSGLSRYDMPEYFLAMDKMPLTASGKILKRDIIERIALSRLTPTPVRWKPSRAATA